MANSTLEILIQAKDNASPAMKNVAASASAMGTQVEAASKKMETAGTRARSFEQAASKIDSAGRSARVGLGNLAQAADLVGVNLSGITGPAGQAADAIGNIVGMVGTFGAVGLAVGALTVAIGFAVKELEKFRAATIDAIATNNDYIRNLYALGQAYPAIAAAAKDYAAALADAQIAQDQYNAAQSSNYIVQAIFAQRAQDAQKALEGEKAALDALVFGATSGYDEVEHLRGGMEDLIVTTDIAVVSAREHAKALAEEGYAADAAALAMRDVDGVVNMAGSHITDTERATRKASTETAAWNRKMEQLGDSIKENDKDLKKWASGADEAVQAAKAAYSKLQSMIEGALSVPDFSAHLAKVQNGAKDAFENMFRFDAVATGTDPAQYGEKFAALSEQLAGMGISAEQAAKGMRDFSIFASNPELINAGLIDMGVVIEDVKGQINAMIGKALFMKSAMEQVWASLSQPQRSALAEQGIENVDDAMTALLDPAGQAKTEVQKLGAEIGAIPSTITSTFYVVKDAAEQAVKEFREVLDQFIADYGNVTISINAETSANAPTGTTPTAPTLPADKEKFASGGSFIIPSRYGYEGFNMGGVATASAGERVTVTPRGQSGGGQFVFNVSVSNDAMLNALMRKVRGLAMMNAT